MRIFIKTHVKVVLFVVLFVLCLCLFYQDVFCCSPYQGSEPKLQEQRPTQIPKYPKRMVTKSISDLKKITGLSSHVLMFNPVPRAGGELFVLLLKWLQGRNNFKHFHLGNAKKGHLEISEQKQLSLNLSNMMQEMAVPMSFDCSTYFTNFSKFGWHSPTHFNVIRDPGVAIKMKWRNLMTEKFNDSRIRQDDNTMNEESYDLSIPYFCGHHPDCSKLNNRWALNRAKEHVVKSYPVVGVLEHLEETLYVLERRIKYFFQGASEIYKLKFQENHNRWKGKLTKHKNKTSRFAKMLAAEYEFYYWIKSRLLDQVTHYNQEESRKTKTPVTEEKINFQIEQP